MALFDLPSLRDDSYETAALVGSGDTKPGSGGMTVSALTNQADLAVYGADNNAMMGGKHLAPALAGHPIAEHPFWTMAGLIGVGALYKFYGPKNEVVDKILSLSGAVAVGITATVVILAEKWFFATVQLPSVTPTMEYL